MCTCGHGMGFRLSRVSAARNSHRAVRLTQVTTDLALNALHQLPPTTRLASPTSTFCNVHCHPPNTGPDAAPSALRQLPIAEALQRVLAPARLAPLVYVGSNEHAYIQADIPPSLLVDTRLHEPPFGALEYTRLL